MDAPSAGARGLRRVTRYRSSRPAATNRRPADCLRGRVARRSLVSRCVAPRATRHDVDPAARAPAARVLAGRHGLEPAAAHRAGVVELGDDTGDHCLKDRVHMSSLTAMSLYATAGAGT